MIQYQKNFINEHLLPVVWQITQGFDSGINNICTWVEEQKQNIEIVLNTQGALLIRGFSAISTAEDFERVITVMSSKLMDYIGGTSPREQVKGNIMTATNIPPSWSIPLHQEMSYTKNSPDRIAFFCLQSAITGGYSTLGDMRQITAKIPANIMNKFQTHGLQLRRSLPSLKTVAKKLGVSKSWCEVFGTNDQAQVNQIAVQKGWQTKWLTEDTLQLWQEILPATKEHPVNKAVTWFNQVHMFASIGSMHWALRDSRTEDHEKISYTRKFFPELLDEMYYGNGDIISDEDIEYIAELLAQSEINVKLNPSDILILDNMLVAHGRTAFSGQRAILVALIKNSDATH
jgi:alpha-ketoglutarate-dependent taurine dioxygenase